MIIIDPHPPAQASSPSHPGADLARHLSALLLPLHSLLAAHFPFLLRWLAPRWAEIDRMLRDVQRTLDLLAAGHFHRPPPTPTAPAAAPRTRAVTPTVPRPTAPPRRPTRPATRITAASAPPRLEPRALASPRIPSSRPPHVSPARITPQTARVRVAPSSRAPPLQKSAETLSAALRLFCYYLVIITNNAV